MAVAAVAAGALVSVSCSSSGHSPNKTSLQSSPGLAAPSPTSPPPVSSAPSPAGTSSRDQILAAYSGYWNAAKRAGLVPIDQVRATLQPYAIPELIAAV